MKKISKTYRYAMSHFLFLELLLQAVFFGPCENGMQCRRTTFIVIGIFCAVCLIVYLIRKTIVSTILATVLSSTVFPLMHYGGCKVSTMRCHTHTFPYFRVMASLCILISLAVLLVTVIYERKTRKHE